MTIKKKGRNIGIAAFGIAAVVAGAILVNDMAGIGLRLNLSHSGPVGIWRVGPFDSSTVARGELVEVCPPAQPIVQVMVQRGYLDRGDCEGTNIAPLLKAVGAVPGDRVTVAKGRAVAVNGQPLPNTEALEHLPAWPDGTYPVQPGQVWLFSTYTPVSFDSRYFGPVELASVRGRAAPVLVHGKADDMARINGGPQS